MRWAVAPARKSGRGLKQQTRGIGRQKTQRSALPSGSCRGLAEVAISAGKAAIGSFIDILNSGPLGWVAMAESIQIQVNGEQRGCQADATVGDLLRELAIKTERVAVELNLEILDRQDFDHRSLKQGDRLEILSFIGGGS